ncbi:MAG TPA: methyl-accepting chemotaxis protein, partial [Jatrophihabitans sp.]|nr:methyl-accepting chemotaxis protein [Jatrophihabitans sp.]
MIDTGVDGVGHRVQVAPHRPVIRPLAEPGATHLPVEAVLEDLAVCALLTDSDGQIRYLNAAARAGLESLGLIGATGTLVGRSVDNLFPPDGTPSPRELPVGPATLRLTERTVHDEAGTPSGRVVSWEDVTARIAEDRSRAALVVDAAATDRVRAALRGIDTVEAATAAALDTVRDAFGWAYAAHWAADDDATLHLRLESRSDGARLRHHLHPPAIAPGTHGLSAQAQQSRDLQAWGERGEFVPGTTGHLPADLLATAGIAFPLLRNGEVVATMEFFATEPVVLTAQRLDSLRNVARLVSGVLERIHNTSALAAIVDSVAAATELLTGLSDEMSRGATQTSDRSASASVASEEVSASIQTVATAAEEMTASIREIAKNAA